MVKFLIFLIIASPSIMLAADPNDIKKINGKWQTQLQEPRKNLWQFKDIFIQYPKIKYIFTIYENKNRKGTSGEHVIEGYIKEVKKNVVNDNILDIDISIYKNVFTIKGGANIPSDLKKCAKINVQMNVTKDGCGSLLREKNAHTIYDSLMILSQDEILAGLWRSFPKTVSQRPTLLNIYPLKKAR